MMNAKTVEKPGRTRTLVVDEQVSVREMVAMVLGREETFAVVAEASSGVEGLRMFRQHAPQLVIAELALPEMNGPEMIRALREENAATRVLVYTGSRHDGLTLGGLRVGAHGFVQKSEPLATLLRAAVAVAEGATFFGPFATRLLDEQVRGGRRAANDGLSPKQRTVLQMVAEGMSTKQVAGRLSLSPRTVEHYRIQLMQKLGLRDVASLTRYAVRCGLVGAE